MEDKYKEIYEQLKKETKDTLDNKNSDKFIDEFKQAVNDRVKEIHAKLDKKRDELIELAVKAHNKESNTELSEEELKLKEKILKGKKKEKQEIVDPNSFKGKVQSLIESLNSVLNKTNSMEQTIQAFKDPNLHKIVRIKDNDFEFNAQKKLEFIMKGKVDWDLGWDMAKMKSNNSELEKDEEKNLKVHANSCYNYYVTNKEITDESVLVRFATDIKKTDGYLYFGVAKNDLNYSNNCMCCTIKDCTYIRSNGNVVENGTTLTNDKLNLNKDGETVIEIRVLGAEKEVYFKVNEEDEQGPYKLPSGKDFRIVSGTCNSANGYIKILNSIVIG